ncbi:MAG: hypothetical protein Q9167_007617 [Letrouitia subvulpina]
MHIFKLFFFYLTVFSPLILAITDYTKAENQTPTLQKIWAAAQKRCYTMQVNKLYAFRQRDDSRITAHTRLIVGHIFKENVDDDNQPWDFQAQQFHLVKDVNNPLDAIWGGKCKRLFSAWTCREGAVFKFKGEVDLQRFGEIQQVADQAQALIDDNDCYNVATNNCKTFASKLAKKVQAPPSPPVASGTVTDSQPFDMVIDFS